MKSAIKDQAFRVMDSFAPGTLFTAHEVYALVTHRQATLAKVASAIRMYPHAAFVESQRNRNIWEKLPI